MAAVIAGLAPVDACPSCHPGDVPASIPLRAVPDGDGIRADYQCAACGTAWHTRFDVHWWPVDRSIVPAQDQTERRAA